MVFPTAPTYISSPPNYYCGPSGGANTWTSAQTYYTYAFEILLNFSSLPTAGPQQYILQIGGNPYIFSSINYNSGIQFNFGTLGGIATSILPLVNGNWYHVVFSYNGGTLNSLYLNGALQGLTASPNLGSVTPSPSGNFCLGNQSPGNSTYSLLANVAMCRFYSNALTAAQVYQNLIQVVNKIPTNVYSLPANILGATNPYLRILLHFDGTNLSTTFTDGSILMINGSNTGSGGTSIVGNAAIITNPSGGTVTTPKFGTGCLGSKNGPSGTTGFFGVWFPSSLNYSFGTSNFTIEFWFLSYSTQQAGASARIASNYTSGSFTTNCMTINCPTSSTAMVLQIFNIGSCSCPAPAGGFGDTTAWHHYAFVRNGTSITGYTDGVAGTPVTNSASFDGGVAAPFILGCNPNDNSGAGYGGNGFMDEFRLQIGVASYTANFTPPTGPFTN
jgi:hypothetical protein